MVDHLYLAQKCLQSSFKFNPNMTVAFTTFNRIIVDWCGISLASCQLTAVNNSFTASRGLSD